ncbi:hypothetical protein Dsin_023913 [Dipteronia sinensis]|uniref:RNase H type-1 domain-containing protein n=1 Tax=Dipteronia sinensis TaxID=43782 RepID=A0AAE0E184_9ROSI|nr:hypothetical protein Dsin_023913 [Dipteronia sinensis]
MGYLLNLKRILRCYEMASGLCINFHKSCIIKVGKKPSTEIDWVELFRCKMTDLPITYLGLPLDANPNKKNFWNSVIQKIENRLAPWKSKFLSKGGILVLIKAVLSSIPIFYMSAFNMPVGVAQKIERIQQEKIKGGLGIGRMLDKNRGLLAKWIWRFGCEENTLWKRVLCAKYGMNIKDLRWEWNITSNPSHLVSSVNVTIRKRIKDRIAWTFTPKGTFTVSFFRNCLDRWDGGSSTIAKGSNDPITAILLNIKEFCVDNPTIKMPKRLVWTPPLTNALKFNVDESSRGKPGHSGIDGVLWNAAGKILCYFSCYVGIQDSNTAEIMAIYKACKLCASKIELQGKDIVVASD